MRKPELLVPASSLEVLKTAVRYGADAVYIGGEVFGLRAKAKNFTLEEMAEGVNFAHKHGVKVYVTANILAHNADLEPVKAYFNDLKKVNPDALIIADPAIFTIAKEILPEMELHISTQANNTNYGTYNFWWNLGAKRVVSARELSIKEIKEIREHIPDDMEIETFVHGAMCISYSGRCTLSNHMSMRDANRGGCSQSCRWKYELFDMPFGTERRSKTSEGEVEEEFSMSAVDMSMIEHIPELIENGVDSFKIEGRMKSIHYVSTVANVYKKAVDSYMEDPENYVCQQEWIDELWKVAQRELATGFYYNTPSENEQLFGERRKIPQYKFVGEVIAYNEKTQVATIRQRNLFSVGDEIEFYGPGFTHFHQTVKEMYNEDGEAIDRAPNPMMLLTMEVTQPVAVGDMIRKKK